MSAHLRVLHLTSDSRIAGTERMILSLFSHYDRDAFDFRLLTLFGPGDLVRESRRLDVPAETLEWNRALAPRAFFRLLASLRAFRPHVLQCYLYHSNLIGRLAGRLAGVPIIVSGLRTLYEDSRQGRSQRAWDRRTFFLTHYSLANSEAGADSLFARDDPRRGRVVVVHNGLALQPLPCPSDARQAVRRELDIPDEAFLFGMIAQLRRHKDHTTLLEALAQLPAARLLFVGSGPTEPEVRARIAQLRLEARVTLAGYRADAPRMLAALDAFVLASEIEGLPVSIMEAMAGGLPVVATRVGGVPELVQEGETGLLVPMRDAGALASAMRRLIQDPATARRMGEAGRLRLERHFSPQAMTRKIETFYRDIAARRGLP